MNHVISLYFEPQLEAVLYQAGERLSAIGLENLADATGGTVRPHITLAAYADVADVDGLTKRFARFAARCQPMSISFQSVGLFVVDQSVLFLAPTVTHELLTIHAELHRHLSDYAKYAVKYYTIGRWVPHSTIGLSVPQAELSRAISAVMGEITSRPTGAVTEIGLDGVSHEPLRAHPIAAYEIPLER